MKTFSLWRFLLLSSVFLLVSGVGLAQFVFEASMRPRAEYRYGYNELAQSDKKPVFTISQRTRLGGFFSSDRVTLKITLQDVRVWGDETLVTSSGVFGDAASIDLAEAWMKFEVTERFSVTLGRQTLSYDDERLLSKRNWNQYGVFYDAVLLQYSTVKTSVNFGASYNNATEMLFLKPYNPKKMKLLGFVHLEKEFHDWLSVSVVSIFTGFTPNDTSLNVYGKLSSGVILEYNKQPWYFMSGFYYQFGKDVSTDNCLVANAYNLNFLGRYKHRYITLELGLSLLSGDKLGDLDKGKTHLFDLLYGARHRYYGYLDYFSNLAVSTGRGGLNDAFSTVGVALSKKTNIFLCGHLLYLNRFPEKLKTNPQMQSDLYLATEFDFWLKTDFWKQVNLQSGYSIMMPGSRLKQLQGVSGKAPLSSWAWLMLTVSLSSSEKALFVE